MDKRKKRMAVQWSFLLIALLISFFSGWYFSALANRTIPPKSLRLNGYQFIDPLLACNINNSRIFPENRSLNGAIASIIDDHQQAGDISKASVYFADFSNGNWASVNQDKTYYPSSLGKIPIMIAYYELAENSSTLLNEKITYAGGPDLNQTQDIKPTQAILPGQTYTIEQLIEYMIKYSDNNATQLLFNRIDKNALQNVYGDLGVPVNDDATISNLDFITPQQISILFRILYNATYLSRDDSEKALKLMSESSFTQGIAAGVPSSTIVAHKLGLVGLAPNGITNTEHELHDCGLVYARDPYLLCVMTRGSASLPALEGIISSISQAAYDNVENSN